MGDCVECSRMFCVHYGPFDRNRTPGASDSNATRTRVRSPRAALAGACPLFRVEHTHTHIISDVMWRFVCGRVFTDDDDDGVDEIGLHKQCGIMLERRSGVVH